MADEQTIKYRNYDIELMHPIYSEGWIYLISYLGFYCDSDLIIFEDFEEALSTARENVDFLIFLESQ